MRFEIVSNHINFLTNKKKNKKNKNISNQLFSMAEIKLIPVMDERSDQSELLRKYIITIILIKNWITTVVYILIYPPPLL